MGLCKYQGWILVHKQNSQTDKKSSMILIRTFWWVVALLITFIFVDIIGNLLLILLGGFRKVKFHSRFFFIKRDKWDKAKT